MRASVESQHPRDRALAREFRPTATSPQKRSAGDSCARTVPCTGLTATSMVPFARLASVCTGGYPITHGISLTVRRRFREASRLSVAGGPCLFGIFRSSGCGLGPPVPLADRLHRFSRTGPSRREPAVHLEHSLGHPGHGPGDGPACASNISSTHVGILPVSPSVTALICRDILQWPT